MISHLKIIIGITAVTFSMLDIMLEKEVGNYKFYGFDQEGKIWHDVKMLPDTQAIEIMFYECQTLRYAAFMEAFFGQFNFST